MNELTCVLSAPSSLSCQLSTTESLKCVLTSSEQSLCGTISHSDDLPLYNGDYEITPQKDGDVTLETGGRGMRGDVVVRAIPYYETTNMSGGYTVIIG